LAAARKLDCAKLLGRKLGDKAATLISQFLDDAAIGKILAADKADPNDSDYAKKQKEVEQLLSMFSGLSLVSE